MEISDFADSNDSESGEEELDVDAEAKFAVAVESAGSWSVAAGEFCEFVAPAVGALVVVGDFFRFLSFNEEKEKRRLRLVASVARDGVDVAKSLVVEDVVSS
jgi:hypothetical protein